MNESADNKLAKPLQSRYNLHLAIDKLLGRILDLENNIDPILIPESSTSPRPDDSVEVAPAQSPMSDEISHLGAAIRQCTDAVDDLISRVDSDVIAVP